MEVERVFDDVFNLFTRFYDEPTVILFLHSAMR